MKRQLITAAVLGALAFLPIAAQAASTTTTFTVTATVPAMCKVSATNLAFGTLTPSVLTAATDANSTITVQCTPTTAYTIGLNAGTSAGATTTTRAMTGTVGSTTYTLPYQLYQDSTYSQYWGNGATSTSDLVSATAATGAPVNYTVYGQIPAQTAFPAATSYSDTITVTLTY